jgi:hypothetical protein
VIDEYPTRKDERKLLAELNVRHGCRSTDRKSERRAPRRKVIGGRPKRDNISVRFAKSLAGETMLAAQLMITTLARRSEEANRLIW